MEISSINILRQLGLAETLAFKFSNYNSFNKHSSFNKHYDWGRRQWN